MLSRHRTQPRLIPALAVLALTLAISWTFTPPAAAAPTADDTAGPRALQSFVLPFWASAVDWLRSLSPLDVVIAADEDPPPCDPEVDPECECDPFTDPECDPGGDPGGGTGVMDPNG